MNEKLEPWKTSCVFIRKFKHIDEIIAKKTDVSEKFVDSIEEYRTRLNHKKKLLYRMLTKNIKIKMCFSMTNLYLCLNIYFFKALINYPLFKLNRLNGMIMKVFAMRSMLFI